MPTSHPPRPVDIRIDDRADHAMTVLPRDRRTPFDARAWLRGFLDPRVGADLVNDATLVLSELATNALRHGLGEVAIRASLGTDGEVHIAVTDSGSELPVLQPLDPDRVGGLGLRVIDRLSSAWGVAPFPGGKTVWATVRSR
jgi:anti-sigma regulatory factor (Ser/Thr protein kinase)